MKARAKFYVCEKCHNVMELVLDGNGRKITCSSQDMKELEANTSEGALEKHIPDVTVEGDKVTVLVGNGEHPIEKDHSIMWVALETTEGLQKKYIHQEYVSTSDKPRGIFVTVDDERVAAYSYCNQHGLWRKDIKMK